MNMDDDFIENNDLDWFASFSNGYLAHFASGGTNVIPDNVKSSLESYEVIYDYFNGLTGKFEFEIIEEYLPHFDNQMKKKQYVNSFTDAASKGLFSYNINFDSGTYFLIAKPLRALLLSELPENIRNKLSELPKDIEIGSQSISFKI